VPLCSAFDLAWRPTLCAVLCLVLVGCVGTPLKDRDWVEIHTRHYDIWSSLPRGDSMDLAIDLEHFRTAAAFLSGKEIPTDAVVTRVFAFDDRGIGRPFSYQSQRSYLLPRQPGDVIVLRTGGGWEGDAWTPLKLEYARRLIWNASPVVPPPWLDEGLPQFASTLESREDGARAGVPRADHIRALRDSQWVPFDRLLGAADLSGWSSLERQIFEAESWALCHYLFSEDQKLVSGGALARFRARIGDGVAPGEAARSEFGEPGPLQHDVWRVIRTGDLEESALQIKWAGGAPTPRAVPQQEVLEQLGGLALAIGRQDLAAGFLAAAQKLGVGSARSLATWGDLLEASGDRNGADARYEAALAAAPDDPVIHLRLADLLRARAADSSDPAQRVQLAGLARSHYARSLASNGALAEAHAGLAATYFVDHEDPSGTLAHARAARKLLPGDGEVGLLAARLELAFGDREAAHREATREMTRARRASDLDAARSLLAQIDEQVSIR
jgi:tetratricopeptide (TPR) repeat protein